MFLGENIIKTEVNMKFFLALLVILFSFSCYSMETTETIQPLKLVVGNHIFYDCYESTWSCNSETTPKIRYDLCFVFKEASYYCLLLKKDKSNTEIPEND